MNYFLSYTRQVCLLSCPYVVLMEIYFLIMILVEMLFPISGTCPDETHFRHLEKWVRLSRQPSWVDPEGGGTGGPDPTGIARLLIFAMLKFSVRPLLGICPPPPPPPRENFLDPRMPLISEWSILKIQILYFMLYGKHCKFCAKKIN